MKIIINDQRKIFTVQQEFNSLFPYLKLEFLTKANTTDGRYLSRIIKQNNKTLGECRTRHNMGTLNITPSMTVADMEQNFRKIYGLGVMVLRKSGKVWLETTVTDGWTLDEQNRQGEDLSR